MTSVDTSGAEVAAALLAGSRRPGGLRRFFAIRSGLTGSIGALLIVGLALVGPLVAPDNPYAINYTPLLGPSHAHLLGTDLLGRDVWSRFLTGGASVIVLPLIAVSGALVIGCVAGLMAGYLGGWTDTIVTRIYLGVPFFGQTRTLQRVPRLSSEGWC